jgi:S-DNA-T family DNA segregation ATPase FtsK/SpoIIIE
MHGPVAAVVTAVVATAGLAVWAQAHRASFDATVGRVLWGTWRSAWTYGLRWRASMIFAGLGGRLDGDEWIPRVVRVRAGRYVDRVTVRMVVGQQPADWERRSDALAVVSREVVDAADRCLAADGRVAGVMVVGVQPDVEPATAI